MNPAETKAARLLQIEALLLAHPEGLPQAELARRLGVHRSTVLRSLPDLPGHIYQDGGRLFIDRQVYLINVRLSLHEALALHLAARLLAARLDRRNCHAAGALRKLGLALGSIAPLIGKHVLSSADLMDDAHQRQDPVYLAALERLTLAWAEQRKVQVWFRRPEGEISTYTLATYFIEPNAIGQSTYVIGWRDPPGALRTFKIERLERVELLRESYAIPAEFDIRRLLEDAWGIWYTEDEPVEVVLKFSPRIARRVRETRWHRSEQVTEQPDGSLIWRARVAEPKEMLPWVRGWGADCEVLAPEGMREAIIEEVKRLQQVYDGE